MKKLRWYVPALIIGLLALLLDVYAYGGLGEEPRVGAVVAEQARLQAPLVHTYLVAGRYALQVTPFMHDTARTMASRTWGEAYDAVRAHPELALYELDAQSHGGLHMFVSATFWMAPACLLLALVLWIFRSRTISLIRKG